MNTNIGRKDRMSGQMMRRLILLVSAIVFALALTVSQSQLAQAGSATIESPDVSSVIQVPAGNRLFRVAHAVGTQNYICLSTGWASAAYGPQATLFDEDNEQILTHFLGAYPVGSGSFFPTWQDSRDSSVVWASPVPDAKYTPDPTAVPWLLLKVVDTAAGPTGGDKMTVTTYVQRLNTTGGIKPTTACSEGDKYLVPYTADYYFYKAAK